ncbi:MAG: hypothetical protein Q8R76_06575 [Candidatus Omnitrophota bacterium]|nr:hypothetical protein [Candidatus Omnitrophota bacterium]
MSIEKIFNKEEFRRLLFLTFLGEWVMNAHRGVSSKTEYTYVLDKILGYAQQMGLDQYVTWEKEPGKIGPSCQLENECREFMSEYENRFFLEELADRFSKIDVEALIRYQKEHPEVF